MSLTLTPEDRVNLKELLDTIHETKLYLENEELKKALKANQEEISKLRGK